VSFHLLTSGALTVASDKIIRYTLNGRLETTAGPIAITLQRTGDNAGRPGTALATSLAHDQNATAFQNRLLQSYR
jgi:hypothetical protein